MFFLWVILITFIYFIFLIFPIMRKKKTKGGKNTSAKCEMMKPNKSRNELWESKGQVTSTFCHFAR